MPNTSTSDSSKILQNRPQSVSPSTFSNWLFIRVFGTCTCISHLRQIAPMLEARTTLRIPFSSAQRFGVSLVRITKLLTVFAASCLLALRRRSISKALRISPNYPPVNQEAKLLGLCSRPPFLTVDRPGLKLNPAPTAEKHAEPLHTPPPPRRSWCRGR